MVKNNSPLWRLLSRHALSRQLSREQPQLVFFNSDGCASYLEGHFVRTSVA
jgi:hypothetical protein